MKKILRKLLIINGLSPKVLYITKASVFEPMPLSFCENQCLILSRFLVCVCRYPVIPH
jgi:hypothetical protein